MNYFLNIVTKHKKAVVITFALITFICLIMLLFVDVNYNLIDYLPSEAKSTKAIGIMEEDFSDPMPNANVMIKNVSLSESLVYKSKLASIQGVSHIIWLDDMIDLKLPLEMSDPDIISNFYKDKNALFTVTISKGMESKACNEILDLIGPDNALAGQAPGLVFAQETTTSSVLKAFAVLLPVIILILILSTSSWVEPIVFLLTIGISIIINMGTNLIFGNISFITNSISPILQLACSLDYAVFLLHSFQDKREKFGDPAIAMRYAVRESMSTIAASAATTLFGFLALLFMDFGVGADLGIVLAKGIVFSFISVIVFLPAFILSIYKIIDKTAHRPFLPDFKNIHKILSKITIPVVAIVAILIVPAFLGQSQTAFIYGSELNDPSSRFGMDTETVEKLFGKSNIMAVLVPRGEVAKEQLLSDEINQLDRVTGVVSYASTVSAVVPPEYLGKEITDQFYSDNYARVIIYTDTPSEGDAAFNTVMAVDDITQSYYGDDFYMLGQSANLYDMKNIVKKDNTTVNLIAIVAIFVTVAIAFRSAVIPIILVLTIEAGIWINLAIPYFSGTQIHFLGYLVISTIQLGATVDYGILLTNTYLNNRKLMPKRQAITSSLGRAFKSILVSALTLSTAGYTLHLTSSNVSVSDIGLLIGRGTLLSLILVLCLLPVLLVIFDKAIEKTTAKSDFYYDSK